MIDKNKCAIFIPTYKRADKVFTYKTLRKFGWTDKIYLVVGDDDPELEKYQELYKNEVLIFSKKDVRNKFDMIDNFDKNNCVVFARNVIFELAKQVGIDYFLVLDDDYESFVFRRVFTNFEGDETLKAFKIKHLYEIIYSCFNYLAETKRIDCFAFCQDGDFIGGAETFPAINFKRKIMNSFFFATDRVVKFLGRLNEDLNASVYNGQRGQLLFTINDVSIKQKITQSNPGGLTDIYLDLGTYVKSFYSVICCPNGVKISSMGNNDYRIHHKVLWNKIAPKIMRENIKK